MKKIISFFITLFSLILLSLTTYAAEPATTDTIKFFDNGDYLITSIEDEASASDIALLSTTTTKSKTSVSFFILLSCRQHVKGNL